MKQILFRTTQINIDELNKCKKTYGIAKKIIFNNLISKIAEMDVDELKGFVNENLGYNGDKIAMKIVIAENTRKVVEEKFSDVKAGDIYHSAITYFCKLDELQKIEFLKKY